MHDLKQLHTNQRLLLEELIARGATVEILDVENEWVRVTLDGVAHDLIDRTSPVVSHVPAVLAADKFMTKRILRAENIRVPDGGLFSEDTVEEALRFAAARDYKVVFKPNHGSHGRDVETEVNGEEGLLRIIERYLNRAGDADFIIEALVEGLEHRVFITTKGDYAVLQREPAHVVGDGKNTIEYLADAETNRRAKVKREQGSALCPVAIDKGAERFLKSAKRSLSDVPAAGEKVYLRRISNLALGGVSRDMTEVAHPSVIRIAEKILGCFKGLAVIGVDFITPDITRDQSGMAYGIIEVNANPGLSMHMMPAIGDPQPVARYLADVMFP